MNKKLTIIIIIVILIAVLLFVLFVLPSLLPSGGMGNIFGTPSGESPPPFPE
jgi:preprotein translocase subunit SecG